MDRHLTPYNQVAGYIALTFLFLLIAWAIEFRQRSPATRLILTGILSVILACGYGMLEEPSVALLATTLTKIGFVLVLAGVAYTLLPSGPKQLPANEAERV